MRALAARGALALFLLLAPFLAARTFAASGGAAAIAQAEALAAEASGLIATQPKEAVARARRALTLTSDFDPIVFVKAGRKGEVVEDEFVAARNDYRRHRAQALRGPGRGPRRQRLAFAREPVPSAGGASRSGHSALHRAGARAPGPGARGGGGGRAGEDRGSRRVPAGSASPGRPGGGRRGLAQRPGRDRPGAAEGPVPGQRRVA